MTRQQAFGWCAIAGLLSIGSGISAQPLVDFGDDTSRWANDGECDDPRFAGGGMASALSSENAFRDATDCARLLESGEIRLSGESGGNADAIRRGALTPGDETLDSGEFVDSFMFDADIGDEAIIDLRSTEFDTYLIVETPNGEQFDNDDYEGDRNRSLIAFDVQEAGTYSVHVTSYEMGETGSYALDMRVGESASTLGVVEHRGELEYGDATLGTGEYVDRYEFSGRPGQRVRVDLRSNDFDTYVMLVPPAGERLENDDDESTSHSRIETDISELGTYRVLVTSYEDGEAGDYVLTIDQYDPSQGRPQENRDVMDLAIGGRTSGMLEAGDRQLEDGGYRDVYVFDGEAGQTVRVEMRSRDFDTYVALVTPSEQSIQNDDYDGDTRRSVVEMTLPDSGRYRVVATSYGPSESGSYEVTVRAVAASDDDERRRKRGKTYGIFAGIGDYPGDDMDLSYTADDALRLRDALVSGAGMRLNDQITLTDRQATRSALRRAVRDIGRRARPEDTFVFFFSGHGDRVERSEGPQSTDPDALDETIELYDGAISDDELSDLFAELRAGKSLIFIDSCYSGGFAKDMISVPGRMGMFSSEEDLTSSVAAKFRAGGYLSLFLSDAIGRKLADFDGDRGISAIELSQYVYVRYRGDVKSGGNELVRTSGPRTGHQHLVVDRGSIGPYETLFQ